MKTDYRDAATGDSSSYSCTLSCRELQERKQKVFADLNQKRLSKTEIVNGYAFTFQLNMQTEDEVADFIANEKECCSFLKFNVTKHTDVLKVEITGAQDVKAFIDDHITI